MITRLFLLVILPLFPTTTELTKLSTELARFDTIVQASSSAGVKVIIVLRNGDEIIKHVSHWESTTDSVKFAVDFEGDIRKLVLLDPHDYSIATVKTRENKAILRRSDVKEVPATKFYLEYCHHGDQCEDTFHFMEVH